MLQKIADRPHWITIAFALLMALIGTLGIWWKHSPTTAAPAASMRIGNIDQTVENGDAVAGVQGDVTVSKTPDQKPAQAKQ